MNVRLSLWNVLLLLTIVMIVANAEGQTVLHQARANGMTPAHPHWRSYLERLQDPAVSYPGPPHVHCFEVRAEFNKDRPGSYQCRGASARIEVARDTIVDLGWRVVDTETVEISGIGLLEHKGHVAIRMDTVGAFTYELVARNRRKAGDPSRTRTTRFRVTIVVAEPSAGCGPATTLESTASGYLIIRAHSCAGDEESRYYLASARTRR